VAAFLKCGNTSSTSGIPEDQQKESIVSKNLND
jgi:hypothetical protein